MPNVVKIAGFVMAIASSAACGVGPGPTGRGSPLDVAAVDSRDGSNLVAIGGTKALGLAVSDDSGRSWRVSAPAGPAMTTIAVLGSGRLVGATSCLTNENANGPTGPAPKSCMYASTDGGLTWIDLNVGRVVDPSFSDATHGWARPPIDAPLETPSQMYASADAGVTWSVVPSPCSGDTPWIRQAVATAADAGFVLCTGKSPGPNTAQAWSFVEMLSGGTLEIRSSSATTALPVDHLVTGFTMRAGGHGFLWVGDLLFSTVDRGTTWIRSAVTVPAHGVFERGILVTDTAAYVAELSVGNETGILATSDGGATWTQLVSWRYDWGN